MKLLFDENLSPRLAARLADLFPGSAHVHECGLGEGADTAIWDYAANNGFAIVSKDLDFHERSLLASGPPKVVWLRTGNCATRQVEQLLRLHAVAVERFSADPLSSLLILP